MKHKITSNPFRIGLHDSHLYDIGDNKVNILIKVDWGFLENFSEENIQESIVFDEAELYFDNVQLQTFFELQNDNTIQMDRPSSFGQDKWLVMTNENRIEGDFLTSTFTLTNDEKYLQWTIVYKTFQLSWDKYILHENWLTEKESLPNN